MAAKVPKKDGKGHEYLSVGHVVGLDGKIRGERKRLLYMDPGENMQWKAELDIRNQYRSRVISIKR